MEGKDEVTNKMEKLNVDEVKEEEKVDPNDRQALEKSKYLKVFKTSIGTKKVDS